ncbi:MAG TPA: hypothetical protein VGK67_39125 [Myxococcales bacterium]|jgi:hypothetical protein
MRTTATIASLSLAALLSGCRAPEAAPPAAAPKASTTQAAQQPTKAAVSKIVFIDKELACECTQKAIEASWTALQSALDGAAVPVERIHMDTQAAFAAGYKDKKPMMAIPGIYFLAEGGSVVELLQGTVTAEQIKAVLN